MNMIDGYWDEWVTRPGERVALHLSGAGPSRVTLHPLEGNNVLEAINALGWSGDLIEREYTFGSAASECVDDQAQTRWSLELDLRIESAPTQRSAVALITFADGTDIEITCINERINVSGRGLLLDSPVDIGRWFSICITHDAAAITGTVHQTDDLAKGTHTVSHSQLSIPTRFALGAATINTAHFRVCIIKLSCDNELFALFEHPERTNQRNNPTWGMADSTGKHTAIRFHPEDIGDVGWPATASFELPVDLEPGVYVATCTNDAGTTYVPLFVEPTIPIHRIAVVMSTFTYLAYANYRQSSEQDVLGDYRDVTDREIVLSDVDRRLAKGVEPGWSLYDRYSDGVATYIVSRRRPLLDLVPGHTNWMTGATRNYTSDLELLGWLKSIGTPVDVITDDRLHSEGERVLDHYDTVITGSHVPAKYPELIDTLDNSYILPVTFSA